MEEEVVGWLYEGGLLGDIDLLFASSALIAFNLLTSGVSIKRLLEVAVALDRDGQDVKGLDIGSDVAALGADELGGGGALEDVFEDVLLFGGLDEGLNLVESDVEELMGILLSLHVRSLSSLIFESKTEIESSCVCAF